MPRGDGTGPMGQGPMTGRAAGFCAGYASPGYMNSWGAGGMGWGRGWHRGGRWGGRAWGAAAPMFPAYARYTPPFSPAAPSAKTELTWLRSQAEQLRATLEAMEEEIGQLERESEE